MYKSIIRPILFTFKPETIHSIIFASLRIMQHIPGTSVLTRKLFLYKTSSAEKEVFGIKFPNPIGLAAGLDKNANVYNTFGNMGFGFVEIGTITPKAQKGNPKPRLFRMKKNKALINRMGFNNEGIDYAIKKLRKNKTVIVGGNIGKNKMTPNKDAILDYEICFNSLFPYVDYFVINVSSPNTPDLRELQNKEPLEKLLSHIQNLNNNKPNRKPVLLKIAPDLTFEQIDDIIEIVERTKIDGLIATNTTISREGLSYTKEEIEQIGMGGLSGKPLTKRSTEIIKYISDKTNKKIPIIGVGGIMNEKDAIEKLEAGASLIQIYTAFIYEGPSFVKKLLKKMAL